MAIYRGEGGAGDATADASNAAALADAFADAANASAGQAATSAAAALAAQLAAELAETNAETAETNAEAAEAAAVVAKNAAEAVLLDTGFTVVASDLQGADTIGTVAADIVNVNAVANNIDAVIAVDANEANINIVAADGTDIGTVAASIADVNSVAANILDVTAVADNETNIDAVAANNTNITTVAGISANVTTVAGISANVTTVATNDTNVTTVATNIANVNSVGTNIANVNSVAGNATNINAVAANSTNINTVAGISANVTTVATNNANVTTVAGSIANVNTNATNIANINQNAANIVAIQNASANATAAASSATAAAGSATSASASAAAASAVALGNEPVRHSVRPSLLLDFANTKTLDPRITFTRASTGTFYDGKTVAKAEENLVIYSQEIDNAAWAKFNATVTANSTAAPDGTTTAETITDDATNSGHSVRSSTVQSIAISSGTTCVGSVYFKAGTNTFATLALNDTGTGHYAAAVIDLSTGTITQTNTLVGTLNSSSVVDAGNGWYRVIINCTAGSSGFNSLRVSPAPAGTGNTFAAGAAVYVGTGTTIHVWGAQVERRDAVTAYTATTTAPITNYIPALQSAASGVARFEHNPTTGESLGLEIEEQRTNLLVRSEEFDNVIWSKTQSTVTSNTVVAPDGTLTGDALIEDTTNNQHSLGTGFTASTITYTLSVFVKAAGRTKFQFTSNAGRIPGAEFDLSAVTATVLGTSSSASITPVGNGWFRCTATRTTATAGGDSVLFRLMSDTTFSYTGDGYSGIYIWGAQLEAGAFATSYIPTTTAQVTRSADAASMTGTNFSSWYRADEGTIYCDASGRQPQVIFTNTTAIGNYNNYRSFYRAAPSTGQPIRAYEANNGVASVNVISGILVTNGSDFKVSYAFKADDFAISGNAVAPLTDTSGLPALAVDRMGIGYDFPASQATQTAYYKKIAFYPKRLTNAELQGLTTV